MHHLPMRHALARHLTMRNVRRLSVLLLAACMFGGAATAQTTAPPKKDASPTGSRAAEEAHRKADIAKHRQMAQAHDEAARCLERGEKESLCQERLKAACKGIAVGRYCGMRHGG